MDGHEGKEKVMEGKARKIKIKAKLKEEVKSTGKKLIKKVRATLKARRLEPK